MPSALLPTACPALSHPSQAWDTHALASVLTAFIASLNTTWRVQFPGILVGEAEVCCILVPSTLTPDSHRRLCRAQKEPLGAWHLSSTLVLLRLVMPMSGWGLSLAGLPRRASILSIFQLCSLVISRRLQAPVYLVSDVLKVSSPHLLLTWLGDLISFSLGYPVKQSASCFHNLK